MKKGHLSMVILGCVLKNPCGDLALTGGIGYGTTLLNAALAGCGTSQIMVDGGYRFLNGISGRLGSNFPFKAASIFSCITIAASA